MKDLQEVLFYKIKFTIEAKQKESDLLWDIVVQIKDWMTRKHNRYTENLAKDIHQWSELKNGGKIIGRGIKIFAEKCFVESPFPANYWACKIIEYPKAESDYAPRQWTTEIGVEPLDIGKVSFSCIISYSDRPGFVGECASIPDPSVPKIVTMIWDNPNFDCYNGIDKPSIEPRKIAVGEWLPFWERLNDSNRTIPYIYISPKNCLDDGAPLLASPNQVALATGGNAIIYYAEDVNVTDEMNYCCPEEYKCYDGAIRIYYPEIDESQPKDSYRHRYLGTQFIAKVGELGLIQILRRAIAQDVHFYDSFFRIEDCKAKREAIIRQKRLDELKQQHIQELATKEKKHSKKVESIENEAIEFAENAERKQLEAEDRAAHFEEENKNLREENYNLRSENDSYKSLAKENADLKKVCSNRLATKEYPQTPQEIVQYFEASFGDKIAFSDEVSDSLKGCRIPLDDLWKALFALATVMDDLYINGSGDIYGEFRSKTGIQLGRGEGSSTRKDAKLMRQYQIEYHGEIINIEAHIKHQRTSQRIHFGFSKKDRKLIVGWCGEHKDNYTTRKVH